MLHPGEWPLVRDHRFKLLVLIGDPAASLICRRFYEVNEITNRYTARGEEGEEREEGEGGIQLLRIELSPFETDKANAPYIADLRRRNRHDPQFQFHDLPALDEHLRSFQPPEAELSRLGDDERWLLLSHHNFLVSSPELLRAAHKLVLVATTEDLLFEAYCTTATEGLEYYLRCVHPGVQVSARKGDGCLAACLPACWRATGAAGQSWCTSRATLFTSAKTS